MGNLGSALGSAPKGALGNRSAPGSAPGGAPEGVQGNWGVLQEVLLNGVRQQEEHSREHFLEHPPIPLSTLHTSAWRTPISQSTTGSTSQSTSRDIPLSIEILDPDHLDLSTPKVHNRNH